jgi:tRNA (guanine-N7-)-methyltransferase
VGDVPRYITSFGRRKGRVLRPSQQKLIDTLLPSLTITLPDGNLDMTSLFPAAEQYVMEIGFGGGEHLAAQAEANPDAGFIGCEPYLNGVAKLLRHINAKQVGNIRIYTDDARFLLEKLMPESLDKVYILFPDPWPKARHANRRIINAQTLNLLARVVKPGGALQLASDDPAYIEWMLEVLLQDSRFEWLAEKADDFRMPPPGWVATRYQEKTEAMGRKPVFLLFTKI